MDIVLDRQTCLQETLHDLMQDARLLQLTIRGSDSTIEPLTAECLLRLTDYLQQHVNDLCFLYKQNLSGA